MLIMASVIRVGQSKFVTVPIDEDSTERVMNCIQTLSELESMPPVHQIFLKDTKAAYSKMVAAQEKKAAEKRESEQAKAKIVQVDDLLSFRQFSKKAADDVIDVRIRTYSFHVILAQSVIGLRRRQSRNWCWRGHGRLHLQSQPDITAHWLLRPYLCGSLC